MKIITRALMFIFMATLVFGCVSMGSQRMLLDKSVTFDQYDKIKRIVVEEAANNGFSTLTSEVKPSEHNGWKGQLYFKLVTPAGTDQLYAEMSKRDGHIMLYIHGGGTRANPDRAIKAIRARLEKEGM